MKNISTIAGTLVGFIQLIRFWPASFGGLIIPAFSGFIAWAICNAGYNQGYDDTYTYNESNPNKPKLKTWKVWSVGAAKGTTMLLAAYIAFSWYQHDQRPCIEVSDPLFGGCEEYSSKLTDKEKGIPFNPLNHVAIPLTLSFLFNIGSAAGRMECLKYKQQLKFRG